MKLRMAMVFAKDMQRMTAFYRDGIGLCFLPDESKPDWSEFEARQRSSALGGVMGDVHERLGFRACDGLDPEGNVFTLVQG